MAKIEIENLFGKVIMAETPSRTILYHLQANGLDWMHACGGKARCTTCKVVVLEGLHNLEPLTTGEQRIARQVPLRQNERLSCQAIVTGDIIIRVPDENKLPHIQYSS
jgi:ferredoxin, 2Fe-2S